MSYDRVRIEARQDNTIVGCTNGGFASLSSAFFSILYWLQPIGRDIARRE